MLEGTCKVSPSRAGARSAIQREIYLRRSRELAQAQTITSLGYRYLAFEANGDHRVKSLEMGAP